jgi:anti-anti-sigma factor
MKIRVEVDDEGLRRFSLRGNLTAHSATTIRDELLHELSREGELRLDLSGVTELDAAGTQVLLFLAREASAYGKRLIVTAPSVPVMEVIDLCGLTVTLGLRPPAVEKGG